MTGHLSSFSLVDNDVQAPLIPSVLAAAIHLPLPPNTNESDDKSQSSRWRMLGSTSAKSSTSGQKGKPGSSSLNTGEAQKLGKFFKGLRPSKVPFLKMKPKLIPPRPIRDIGFETFAYLTFIGRVLTPPRSVIPGCTWV